MLIRKAPLGNVWMRGCAVWAVVIFMINIIVWPQWIDRGFSTGGLKWLLWAFPFLVAPLYLCGRFFAESDRVVIFSIQFGCLLALPIFLLTLTPLLVVNIFMTDRSDQFLLMTFFCLCCALAVCRKFKKINYKLEANNYFSKEVKRESGRYFIDREKAKDFCAGKVVERSKWMDAWVPAVLSLTPIGYPLQRAMADIGGGASVMLFVTILTVPVSIYSVSEICGGFRLWCIELREFERKNNIKVLMSS